jgi:hypothetical protein
MLMELASGNRGKIREEKLVKIGTGCIGHVDKVFSARNH